MVGDVSPKSYKHCEVWFDYSLYIDTLDMHKDKHPSLSPCIIAQSAESKENA